MERQPIRRKGYYRALKANKSWAVRISKLPPMSQLFSLMYSPYLSDIINVKNPLMTIFSQSTSGMFHQPVILMSEQGVIFSDIEE